MASLTIRHVTTYRYRQPVAFGEHRMMLRPLDSHDQKVIDATLGITPAPSRLRFDRDAFGNHVAIAEFSAEAAELSFESVVSVDHSPVAPDVPIAGGSAKDPCLGDCRCRHQAEIDNEVAVWARRFCDEAAAADELALMTHLSQQIFESFHYRRRETKGIQAPAETLRLGHGSCRDFAWLMVQAARSLGFAARFASGYLLTKSAAAGATHAWAQVHLSGAGWVDFDPTRGSVGKGSLVTVAVVSDPVDALPLHGTFFGSASDSLGMDVCVTVTQEHS